MKQLRYLETVHDARKRYPWQACVKQWLKVNDTISCFGYPCPTKSTVMTEIAKLLEDPLSQDIKRLWDVLVRRIERQDFATDRIETDPSDFLQFRNILLDEKERDKRIKRHELSLHPILLRHAADLLTINIVYVTVSKKDNAFQISDYKLFTTFAYHVMIVVCFQNQIAFFLHSTTGAFVLKDINNKVLKNRLLQNDDGLDVYQKSF